MKYTTTMEIDLAKLKNNTQLLCKSYNDYKYKMVDLKDNGHGLGLKIIDTMYQFGINYCLVATLKDALIIRKYNKDIDILVSSILSEDEIYDCINNNITITIDSPSYLDMILNMKIKDKLGVQILIDNGSNLIGINKKETLKKMINLIDSDKYLSLVGLYTDITTLGVQDDFYYSEVNNFYKIIKEYTSKDIMFHLNEPIMYHKKISYINGIRFDLSILGIEENINDDFITKMKISNIEKRYQDLEFPNINLELVFNITSEVATIKFVPKGCIVGRDYIAKEDKYVAVVPIGHKDGITKAINYVGIKNFKRNILTDEIDHIMVEVTKDVQVHDKVYILNEERGIYEFLNYLKTNRYYLMSILNSNLTRVYINESETEGTYL